MLSFAARLKLCMDRGSLTLADLARWFGRPHPTVRTWYVEEREPAEGYRNETLRRLKLLEDAITENKGRATRWSPLVPIEITKRERPLYLQRLYNGLDKKVSRRGASG